jgi:hypothetical protein
VGDEVKKPLFVLMVGLFLPLYVFGEGTILWDDFDDPELSANLWLLTEDEGGSVTFRDGYAFLNVTNQTQAGKATDIAIRASPGNLPFRYAGVETRLRCSDDNKLNSDIGGGWRFWGFWDFPGQSGLQFHSAPPESGKNSGFHVVSGVGGTIKFWENVTGIDMLEWHTYTIIWEPGNATYLVDGDVVANTDKVYGYNMDVVIGNTNVVLESPLWWTVEDRIHVPHDTYIQIDYVHIFGITQTTILPTLCMILLPALLRRKD